MNRYFKIVEGDYLIAIGIDDWSGETIAEGEYNKIKTIIDSKPEDTETHYYMLKADTLEYVAIERPEPIVIPPTEYEQGYEQALLDLAEVE